MARIDRAACRLSSLLVLLSGLSVCRASELGSVTGFVKFPGEPPPRAMFANASDHDCPRGIPQNHLLVSQRTLALQNVLVILERKDRRAMPTRVQATLSMDGCMLVPRVQWIPLATSLLLVNKDGAHHHLIATQKGSRLFEVDLPRGSRPVRRPLVVPGLYKIDCATHLWERAWVYASPHDSAAVTDAEGRFTIKNVPAGRYAIRVWHEGWVEKGKDRDGRLEYQPMEENGEVRVAEGETATFSFEALSPTF